MKKFSSDFNAPFCNDKIPTLWIVIIFILSRAILPSYSQPTFNKYSNLGFKGAYLTAVFPTDSCYYAIGDVDIGTTLGGDLAFIKYELNGEPLFKSVVTDTLTRYQLAIPGITLPNLVQGIDKTFALTGQVYHYFPVNVNRIFFIRFSSSGDVLAYKEYNTFQARYAFRDIAPTPDTGYVMVWEKRSAGGKDMHLTKIDKMGNIQWEKDYDKGNAEVPNSIVMDRDGGILVGGTYGNIGIANANYVGRNYIFKTDTAGNVIWEYFSHADSLNIQTNEILPTPDGGWVYTTLRGQEIVHPSGSGVARQGTIVKLDSNRNEEWEVLLGEKNARDESSVIAVMPNGGFVAGGLAVIYDSTPPILGNQLVRLTRINSQGDTSWVRWFRHYNDSASSHYCSGVGPTADGGIIFAGSVQIQFFPGIEIGAWLVKTDSFGCVVPGCHLNVSIDDPPGQPIIKVHPNPVSDMLYVYVNQSSLGGLTDFQNLSDLTTRQITFTLVNAHGQVVKTFSGSDTDLTWMVPVHDLPGGLYVLRAERDGREVYSGKVVVL